MLADAECQAAANSLHTDTLRNDTAQLYALWAKVTQLMAQVVSTVMIQSILKDIEPRQAQSPMRAAAVQESLNAFSQRLRTVYPEYRDIFGPVLLAILYIPS